MAAMQCNFDEFNPAGRLPEQGRLRFVNSVVREAGIDRFAYLKGRSGKRYIFSAINNAEAALYDRAIFAEADDFGTDIAIHDKIPAELKSEHARLYVHILAGEDSGAIVSDLLQ